MKKGFPLIFLLIQLTYSTQYLFAQTTSTTHTGTGDWQANGNWDSTNYPDGNCSCSQIVINDDITIDGNGSVKVIDLTSSTNLTEVLIKANVTLTFENNTELILPSGASLVLESGAQIVGPSNNSGSLINIGGNDVWGNSCTDCTSDPLTGPGSMDENSDPNSPLPVELLYVKGEIKEQSIRVSWATVWEKDNDYFVVEHSTDGRDFQAIGEVQGGGNSTVELNYEFVDHSPASGSNFYRLRQVDYDGAWEHSRIIHLLYSVADEDLINVYPNRVKDRFVVELLKEAIGPVNISLYNQLGHQVREWNFAEGGRVFENYIGRKMQSGVYIVKILRSGKVPATAKIIVE